MCPESRGGCRTPPGGSCLYQAGRGQELRGKNWCGFYRRLHRHRTWAYIGLSDDQFRQLIAHGVTKINDYTALSDAAAENGLLVCTRSRPLTLPT